MLIERIMVGPNAPLARTAEKKNATNRTIRKCVRLEMSSISVSNSCD